MTACLPPIIEARLEALPIHPFLSGDLKLARLDLPDCLPRVAVLLTQTQQLCHLMGPALAVVALPRKEQVMELPERRALRPEQVRWCPRRECPCHL